MRVYISTQIHVHLITSASINVLVLSDSLFPWTDKRKYTQKKLFSSSNLIIRQTLTVMILRGNLKAALSCTQPNCNHHALPTLSTSFSLVHLQFLI